MKANVLHAGIWLIYAGVVQWVIHDPLKWVIILLISFPTIMVLYKFLVRRFSVMRFLFGMKLRPKVPIAQRQEALPTGQPGTLPSP